MSKITVKIFNRNIKFGTVFHLTNMRYLFLSTIRGYKETSLNDIIAGSRVLLTEFWVKICPAEQNAVKNNSGIHP